MNTLKADESLCPARQSEMLKVPKSERKPYKENIASLEARITAITAERAAIAAKKSQEEA